MNTETIIMQLKTRTEISSLQEEVERLTEKLKKKQERYVEDSVIKFFAQNNLMSDLNTLLTAVGGIAVTFSRP